MVPERLKLFDAVRVNRANRIQLVSGVPVEETKSVHEKLKKWEDDTGDVEDPNESMRDRFVRHFRQAYHLFDMYLQC